MYWLRELFWICLVHNITLSPTYIKSEDNMIADVLSRIMYPDHAVRVEEILSEFEFCCKDELISHSRSVTEKTTKEGSDV